MYHAKIMVLLRGERMQPRLYHVVVLEEVAKMAVRTEMICPNVSEAPQILQEKHYLRKHGPNAYYGQNK